MCAGSSSLRGDMVDGSNAREGKQVRSSWCSSADASGGVTKRAVVIAVEGTVPVEGSQGGDIGL